MDNGKTAYVFNRSNNLLLFDLLLGALCHAHHVCVLRLVILVFEERGPTRLISLNPPSGPDFDLILN